MDNESLAQIFSPTVKRSLADDVAERVRNAILSGQLAPEEPLREAVLSELLGVSRGPVRKALSSLEREGLVVVSPTGRTCVARLSRQDLDEVYGLRRVLERFAVGCACERATSADLAEMQAQINDLTAHIQRGITEQEAAELDLRFHDVLYRASGHQRLGNFWTSLRPQIYVFLLSRNVANPDFRESVVRGHQQILDAIRDRDKDRAQLLIEGHLDFAYSRVIGSYSLTDDNQG